jgi:predicted TIM-barrel fold metal-dependent hydrolase
VSLKSVVAYRTGLEIQRNGEEVVRKAHDELLAEVGSGKSIRDILTGRSKQIKTVYDYLIFLGVEDSVSLNVPFQIHVGMGDTPSIDLRISNPILLRELINDGSSREARIVLTHGGYPYVEEAGFLVSTYPNVFLDLSETMPFTGVGIKEKLRGLLSMAPATKLMYGSDGFNIHELHWFSSIQTKRVLSAVLNEMLGSGEMEEEWAYEAARQFLRENARRVYKL